MVSEHLKLLRLEPGLTMVEKLQLTLERHASLRSERLMFPCFLEPPRGPESAGTKTTGLVNMPGPNRN